MKCFIHHIIAAIVIFINANKAFGQNTHLVMDQLAKRLDTIATKIIRTNVYLRTNKEIYVSGEDLRFNTFILDAQTFALSAIDQTLYIQLQQKGSDSTVWEEMYPARNGISGGQVYLPQTLPAGDYLLKAYTAHSFFSGQPYFYAIAPIKVVKEPRDIRKSAWQRRAPAVENSNIQFRVFPEGGHVIAGLSNQIAFKAVNSNGTPVEVEGTLLKDNLPMLKFKTSHAGMGKLEFRPERDASYRIQLKNNDSLYSIPEIRENGMIMHLEKNGQDSLLFKIVASHTTEKRKIFIRLQIRGMVQSIAAGSLTDSLEVKIPIKNCPQGIAEATLFDERLLPLCERLVYLHHDQKLNISVSKVKEQYGQKEKISVKIKTTDPRGNAVPASLSLRVYDKLFDIPSNTRDIASYFLLSTQIRGKIYNPSYYFDSAYMGRKDALDLLLLTQGWRRYTWNEEFLKQEVSKEKLFLSDSLPVHLSIAKKLKKDEQPLSFMLFNYNKSINQFSVSDSNDILFLTPQNLAIGSRFFIKYFSEKEYSIKVSNAFENIKVMEGIHKPEYVFTEKCWPEEIDIVDSSNLIQYGETLNAVTITAKGRSYSDKYSGYLDSIAKFEDNTDYVGICGWLNCPACTDRTKPVEGTVYSELTESKKGQVSSHPFSFTSNDVRKVTYHYPKYTEEELLKKFRMVVTKGYFQSREFYQPDYDIEDRSAPDNRNSIAWNPLIATDAKGEATISFYSSDIQTRFIGIIEGVSEEGLLGVSRFHFNVK